MLDSGIDHEQSVEIAILVHETLNLIKSALPHVTVSDQGILAKFIRILENPIEDPNDFRQMLLCATYLAKDFNGHPAVDKLYELIDVSLNAFGEEVKSAFLDTVASIDFQSEIGLNDPALLEDTKSYMGLSLGFGRDPLDKFPSAKMNFPFKKVHEDWFRNVSHITDKEIHEYAFIRGEIDGNAERFKDWPQDLFLKYTNEFEKYCAMCAVNLAEIATVEKSDAHIDDSFYTLASGVSNLNENLRLLQTYCNLESNIGLFSGITHTPEKGLFEITKFFGKEATFIVSDKLYLYHLYRGLNKIVGHPDRNPLDNHDKMATLDSIRDSISPNSPNYKILDAFLSWIALTTDRLIIEEASDEKTEKEALTFAVESIESELKKTHRLHIF